LDLELTTPYGEDEEEQREESPAGGEPFAEDTGSRLVMHPGFHSDSLPDDRDVIVYLPPGYEGEPLRSYPVLYMQDGQNLFDPETSFIRGRTWEIREHADRLILGGDIEPLIVVGIYNTPRRLEEYTHARDRRMGGGQADKYGQMLVYELKPWIDGKYRTRPGGTDTGLGGSSLGGLVSLYLGLLHNETFGKLAVMSPSVWWNHKSIVGFLNEYEGPPWPKIWLDVGDSEGKRAHQDVDLLYKQLIVNGWRAEVSLHYQMVEGGTHDESAWAARVSDMLRFLFPAKQT
jgi:enterochelin esterase-like enzyme